MIDHRLSLSLDQRRLSILVFALYFSWLLAVPFEGQVLYALADRYQFAPQSMIFGAITAHFFGLLCSGFFIKSMRTAKRLMLGSITFCLLSSFTFFFAPSILWGLSLIASSFLAGASVSAWGYFLWSGTPSNERIKTVADGLIYSNILMIVMNMVAIHLSPRVGLGLSILVLIGALFLTTKLPEARAARSQNAAMDLADSTSLVKPLILLCLFIVVITIDSGLMYRVINPAFAHHESLVSWYWAIPYIVAVYIMKNLAKEVNRAYILYVAIAMIGFSYVAFMTFDRSAASYLLVNTLMLGACGVYDLFWWSILGEMLDFGESPAMIFGIGLSANVLGVLLGGFLGNAISTTAVQNPSVLAIVIVLVTLMILPVLNRQLSGLLKGHPYLAAPSTPTPPPKADGFTLIGGLTERESEIAWLLLKGRTYKMIAEELCVSENTVKTHVKHIYAKFNVQSKVELVRLLMAHTPSSPK